jgi:hypothetical protein
LVTEVTDGLQCNVYILFDPGIESVCPICFIPMLSILAEEETANALDSPAHPLEDLGVTKLAASWQCGHLFCRKELSELPLDLDSAEHTGLLPPVQYIEMDK